MDPSSIRPTTGTAILSTGVTKYIVSFKKLVGQRSGNFQTHSRRLLRRLGPNEAVVVQ